MLSLFKIQIIKILTKAILGYVKIYQLYFAGDYTLNKGRVLLAA